MYPYSGSMVKVVAGIIAVVVFGFRSAWVKGFSLYAID